MDQQLRAVIQSNESRFDARTYLKIRFWWSVGRRGCHSSEHAAAVAAGCRRSQEASAISPRVSGTFNIPTQEDERQDPAGTLREYKT